MKLLLIGWAFILLLVLVSAAVPQDQLHLNVQTTDDSGEILTGTFAFQFNITNSTDCTNVLYSNYSELTTDARGIVSYMLTGMSLGFDEEYNLCYYRDGVLRANVSFSRVPYSFTARNATDAQRLQGKTPQQVANLYTETDPRFLNENASLWLQAMNKFNSTYDAKISDNVTFNQSLTDALYASSATVGDNRSWNETRANGLYASSIYGYNSSTADQAFCSTNIISNTSQIISSVWNSSSQTGLTGTKSGNVTINITGGFYGTNITLRTRTPSLVDIVTTFDSGGVLLESSSSSVNGPTITAKSGSVYIQTYYNPNDPSGGGMISQIVGNSNAQLLFRNFDANTGFVSYPNGNMSSIGSTGILFWPQMQTRNVTVESLLKLQAITIPSCNAAMNGSIARNSSGIYACPYGDGTWTRLA